MSPGVLIQRFGTAALVCNAPARELHRQGLDSETVEFLMRPKGERYQRDLDWLSGRNHHMLPLTDTRYPKPLRELGDDAPLLLFVSGDVSLLNDPQIAIVGARKPTPVGEHIARDFATACAAGGLVVSSGLASGIDSSAHQAAIDLHMPTIAVVGTGLDIVYPSTNEKLAQQIVANGALVSEFSCGTRPLPQNFPRRNRIISALSLGVIVVEAKIRSGALITARFARDYGREVFAVPGSIYNELAEGCHYLIQQGAKLVQSADDVLVEIRAQLDLPNMTITPHYSREANNQQVSLTKQELDEEYQQLLDHIGFDPVSPDILVERSHFDVAKISSMLLSLELQGYILSENNFYMRVR